LIESQPDGGIVCRPRAAVRPCSDQYDIDLPESGVFSLAETLGNHEVFDAVIVGDGQDRTGDQVEFIPEEGNSYRGVVRAFPAPWRPVGLVHSSLGVGISTRRLIEFVTDEVIEFVGGTAQCRYPVERIESTDWRYANLGNIKATGKALVSDDPGYSLLAISYVSRAYAWDVSHATIEDVQFLLMEQDNE
jgi:hypothetical protein